MIDMRWADLLDIAIIAVLLYGLLLWLRDRAPRHVLAAFLAIGALYVLARLLNLYLTLSLFQAGSLLLFVALVVVFQHDLRRAVERGFSPGRPRSRSRPEAVQAAIAALVETAGYLGERKTGALIVLRGRESLEGKVRGGVAVAGRISLPLLSSIFNADTPGHDGAVIIDGLRVERLGVQLPLSENLGQLAGRGTRHTAALGLSERTDALVIVVSEEQGTTSVASAGTLEVIDSSQELKTRLEEFYGRHFAPRGADRASSRVLRNPGIKALAALLAVLLWFAAAYRTETIHAIYDLPVEYRNLPADLTLDESSPSRTRVTLIGSDRDFDNLSARELSIAIDLSDSRQGVRQVPVGTSNVKGLGGVTVEPTTLRVALNSKKPDSP